MGPGDPLRRWRVGRELAQRPDRPGGESTATVRAHAGEPVLDALDAERALEAADARELALGREVTVAALAVGSKLKHGCIVPGRAGARSGSRALAAIGKS